MFLEEARALVHKDRYLRTARLPALASALIAGHLVAVPNPRGRGRRWALRLTDGRNAPLFPNRAVMGLLRHGLLR